MTRATTSTAFRNAVQPLDVGQEAFASRGAHACEFPSNLTLTIYNDLSAVEDEWRRFEQVADCTAFQTFDWLATWYRHVGYRDGVRLAITVGRYGDGQIAFVLPLCITRKRLAGRLCWLGEELCDYNAPLLARDFSQRVTPDRFLAAWQELRERLQRDPFLRHDWIELEKMPQTIGDQVNPFSYLDVTLNPSGAHLTRLGDDWQKFYTGKRSSATRRRDRTKRRHMSAFGEIRFITATDQADAGRTLETLMEQKSRSLASKGIADMFARPGRREFFLDVATNPKTRHLIHISRVEIGTTCAAANLGIVIGDCYYHVLASYDDGELSHFGPGALHLRELLAHAIGVGLKRFDFTIGDERYKLEWSDISLKLYDHTAAVTLRGWPASWSSNTLRRVKRFIKQTPLVWSLVSRVRSAVGSLSRPRRSRPRSRGSVASLGLKSSPALACVMGDMDLLRPIALAGIPCAAVARPGGPALYSRYTRFRLPWHDFSNDVDGLVDTLVRFGTAQAERPVLFYEEDAQLLIISRFRERLTQAFRFVVADATLVEDLLDKARFQALAERHSLPVPAARRFNPASVDPADLGIRFPVIVKPLTRLERWNDSLGKHKALAAESPDVLRALWPQLIGLDIDLLAQELIAGTEAQIESYHCYVDQRGGVAGEFTGRKIRTFPQSYGHTTALEITDATAVQRLGRSIVERLALTGVAKLDFKRDPQGNLHLLEINPRFNLWHHAGAVAGVNIPALVYADLMGISRPGARRAKAGVRWCRAWNDFPAARAAGVPMATWLRWIVGCEAKSALSWDDPMPVVRSTFHRLIGRHVGRARAGRGDRRDWASL